MPPLYLALKMLHFVGLALGVGTGFAMLALGMYARALPADARSKLMLGAGGAVSKNGGIGLGLLIVSGLGMFFMRGPASVMAAGGPAFHAKLTLVVILSGVLGYSQVLRKRAREAAGGPALAKLPRVGAALLLLGVAIIIAAVIAFQ
ncbi:MAG: hypothetical protein ABJB12_02825 [Pseudomonadota bacterium]